MKTITIYRSSDFVNRLLDVVVWVNGQKYLLPSNSTLEVDVKEDKTTVQARFLWFKSKKMSYKTEAINEIRVSPLMKNNMVVLVFSLMLLFYLAGRVFESDLILFFFRLFTYSFLGYVLLFTLVLFNRYFRLEINPGKPG